MKKCNEGRNHGHGWGSAPYRHSDSTSRLWAVSKSDCLKQRASMSSLSLFLCSWTLLLLPPTRARLTWKPVRWTLTLKPTIWRSPRPCQSRNIAEPAASTAVIPTRLPVTSRNSDASQQRFPEQHVETHVRSEPAEFSQSNAWKPTWETKLKQQPAYPTKASNKLSFILTELVNLIWMQ